jgi:hypothetical protein
MSIPKSHAKPRLALASPSAEGDRFRVTLRAGILGGPFFPMC